MKIDELGEKSILVLGLGVEGLSTFKYLRALFPDKILGVADRAILESLDPETHELMRSDPCVVLHLGEDYLAALTSYDLVIKTPGISVVKNPEVRRTMDALRLTSHTSLFFANCPGTIVGVTGTKGKGTTCKLIHSILRAGGRDAHLVGNIGNPPLPLLSEAGESSIFVFELSAQQLETLEQSPHVAVLLNVVPDHLDHFVTFENYVRAKQNLARHQSGSDYLIYNARFPVPRNIASESKSEPVAYSTEGLSGRGCFIEDRDVCIHLGDRIERVMSLEEVSAVLPGRFNLDNLLPAVAAAKVLGVDNGSITTGVRNFAPEEYRFDRVGTFRGITFYNASIATVPEVTIEHLGALAGDVQTMMLGGFDRGMDFAALARRILESDVRTVILFPDTGSRIWDAIVEEASKWPGSKLPTHFYIDKMGGPENVMREAVRLAYLHTEPGKICLHSPASPSFGIFKNYKQRGELFRRFVKELEHSGGAHQ